MSFNNLELPDFLVNSLHFMGITIPTPIQNNAIPPGLKGRDILASAQTGTGKTIAYLVPLITRLLNSPADTALILTPTRELATQVKDTAEKLLYKHLPRSIALLIGGDSMRKQFDALKKHPRIVVGTPGRINDHLSRNSLKLQKTRLFVIDEADRMLDMGFEEDLENITQKLSQERQTFMFSATMPSNIVKLSQKYLMNPERISLGSTTKPTEQVNQQTIQTTVSDKFPCLLKELTNREGSIIVFVKTKIGAENLADKLKKENLSVEAIHGDLRQRKREQVIHAFRNQKRRILVATDIAARGLDIPHVRHVVNYDLPQCPEDYIHRIGRTGRAGLAGEAISLLLPGDRQVWRRINDFINQKNGAHSSNTAFQKRTRDRSYQKAKSPFSKGRPSIALTAEKRRFTHNSVQGEYRHFNTPRARTEKVTENNKLHKGPRKKNGLRTRSFDPRSTSYASRAIPSSKTAPFPTINFKSKREGGYNTKKRRADLGRDI